MWLFWAASRDVVACHGAVVVAVGEGRGPWFSGGVVLGHALVQRPERDCGGVFHGAVALLVAVFQQDLMRWGRAHI